MALFFAFGGLNYLTSHALHVYARVSFGNLGFAGTVCGKNVVAWDSASTSLFFQCQGTTAITAVKSSGLLTPRVNEETGEITDNIMTDCY